MSEFDLSQGGVSVSLWRRVLGDDYVQGTPEGRAILGLSPDEPYPLYHELANFFEDWAAVRAHFAAAEGAPSPSPVFETWLRRRDGSRRRLRVCTAQERDPTGAHVANFGAIVDVTDLADALSAARESVQFLEAFFENAPAALAMFDRDLRYMRVSRRWLADYGLQAEAIIGKSHYDVFPEIGEAWKAVHRRCLAGAVERVERDLFVRADGARQWLSWEVRPWSCADGEIGGLLMLSRDITEIINSLECAERSERRLRLALEASGDTVWQHDLRSGELIVFGAMETSLNPSPPPTASSDQMWASVHHLDRAPMRAAYLEAATKGEVLRYEHRLTADEDGPERWALSVIEPQRASGGELVGAIGIIKDITAQKAEQRVLADAHAAAEAASKAKTDFLATMSHEIRTPLNGVLGVAQALGRTPLNDEQRELVRLLMSAGRSLKALVDDTLEIGRIESGVETLTATAFDLAETLEDAILLYAPAAADKNLGFDVEFALAAPAMAMGDPLRVRQIVTNLVSNAVKFTDRGAVTVRVGASIVDTAASPPQWSLVVEVADTGIGIDPAAATRIFDRFVQGDNAARAVRGGAGLGLAIARRLAVAMGGDIALNSQPGSGSTFTFSCVLPAADAPAPARPLESGPFERQAMVRFEILVAEDHPINQKVLSLLLEPFASRLTFVEDGLAACQAAARDDFDLVLMDVQMPVLDGLSAIRLIRSNEAMAGAPRLPIICLTAQASPEQVQAALDAGADAHISKPIDKDALFAAIEAVLDQDARVVSAA